VHRDAGGGQRRRITVSQRLARSREVEAIAAQSLAIRLKQEALDRGDNTEATRNEIEAADKSAHAKNTEAEQSKASALSPAPAARFPAL
jgi:hypothetical protein